MTVEYCFANTVFKYCNGIVPRYIHEMFQPSLCGNSTRLKMAFSIHLRKENTGQKRLSFLGPKILSERNPSIKNFKTAFFYVCPKFFLVIISILLIRSSHFYLVFPPIFSYTFEGDPNGNKHLSELL